VAISNEGSFCLTGQEGLLLRADVGAGAGRVGKVAFLRARVTA